MNKIELRKEIEREINDFGYDFEDIIELYIGSYDEDEMELVLDVLEELGMEHL